MASSTKEKSVIQGRVEKNYKECASTKIPNNFCKHFRLLKIRLYSKTKINFSSKVAK
jgi:hypothetical protein